ncbi:hypothetical protein NQ314_004636 [Rhamnusium bicolor]|uniref:Uncharacterized protein n=1 Tax=Rhamnusium bicolor TaxID=1586634 RepID=A0AAV8ZLI1_9CUCU|nr:hypothetical protein NQ314_004636 [Rhamnusium bicolor]
MSKRVKIAVDRIGKTPDELVAEEMETLSKTTQKRTRKKKNDKNNQKTEEKDIQSKPSRKRAKQKNEDTSDSSKVVNSTENIESVCTEQLELPKQKKTRRKSNKQIQTTAEAVEKPTTGKSSEEDQIIDEDTNELEKYENIAIELKKRRQRKNDLTNKDDIHKKKQNRPHPKKNSSY